MQGFRVRVTGLGIFYGLGLGLAGLLGLWTGLGLRLYGTVAGFGIAYLRYVDHWLQWA